MWKSGWRLSMVVAPLMALVLVGNAAAQEITGNVAITSDYVFRGVSQTLEEAAIQGGVDVTGGPLGLYAGVWGSSVNFGEDLAAGARAQIELDAYFGIAPTVAGFDLDVGMTYYGYPGAAESRSYDFVEVSGGVSRALGAARLGIGAAYSPEFFGRSGGGMWAGVEGSAEVASTGVTIEGSAGHQAIEENGTWGTPDYMTWSAGVSTEVFDVSVGATVIGTDLSEAECFGGAEICRSRIIVVVGRGI